jgi:hypothetical protein
MRQASMSIVMALRTYFEGYDACRARHSTWGSWRM